MDNYEKRGRLLRWQLQFRYFFLISNQTSETSLAIKRFTFSDVDSSLRGVPKHHLTLFIEITMPTRNEAAVFRGESFPLRFLALPENKNFERGVR